MIMSEFASFAIGGFVPSAAIAGVLLLIGLGCFFLSWYKRTNRLLIKYKILKYNF